MALRTRVRFPSPAPSRIFLRGQDKAGASPRLRKNGIAVAGLTSGRGRKNPIKRQDAQKPCVGGFAAPPAIGMSTGNFFVAEDFTRVGLRKRRLGAFRLEVDVVAVRALKNDSVS